MKEFNLIYDIESINKEKKILRIIDPQIPFIFPVLEDGKPIFQPSHKKYKIFNQISEYSGLTPFELIPLFSVFEDSHVYHNRPESRPVDFKGMEYDGFIKDYYPLCPNLKDHLEEIIKHIYEYVSTFECEYVYLKHLHYPFWPCLNLDGPVPDKPSSCFCQRCRNDYETSKKNENTSFSNWLDFRKHVITETFDQIYKFTHRVDKKITFLWELNPPNYDFNINEINKLWGIDLSLFHRDDCRFVVNFNNPFFKYGKEQIPRQLETLKKVLSNDNIIIALPSEFKDDFESYDKVISYPSYFHICEKQ